MEKSVQFAAEENEEETHAQQQNVAQFEREFTPQQMSLDQINDLTTIMIRLITVQINVCLYMSVFSQSWCAL